MGLHCACARSRAVVDVRFEVPSSVLALGVVKEDESISEVDLIFERPKMPKSLSIFACRDVLHVW